LTLENFTINVSSLNVQPGTPLPADVVTTQKLLEYCGMQDAAAYGAAVRGLVAMLVLFVWMGRIRPRWVKSEKLNKWVVFVDKMLMVFVAFHFIAIIVNLLRAG